MKLDRNLIVKRVLPVILGGILGYSYYYFIGCYNGSCPITGSPVISTLYGGVIGFIFALPGKKKIAADSDDK